MFGIDFPELVVILILALVLFGPQKMQEIGEKLGRLVRKFREASANLQQAMNAPATQLAPPTKTPSPYDIRFCTACGQPLSPDFTFCPKCGRRVPREEAAAATGPEPAPPLPPNPPAAPAG